MTQKADPTAAASAAARTAILRRLRTDKPAAVTLPKMPPYKWPGDPVENFRTVLKGFDGASQRFSSRSEALQWLKVNLHASERRVCSSIPDYRGSVTPADYPDPHRCTDIDAFVTESSLGVGEMGSLYLTEADMGHPACALLCTDLYVLIDHRRIVDGMATAYASLPLGDHAYGCFFSGPSATADIEAVHVTGAQAQISLTALIY